MNLCGLLSRLAILTDIILHKTVFVNPQALKSQAIVPESNRIEIKMVKIINLPNVHQALVVVMCDPNSYHVRIVLALMMA
jgi:hypothetical protein